MLFPILWPSSLPVVVAHPDKRHAGRTVSVLERYDRHRAYNNWFKRRRRTIPLTWNREIRFENFFSTFWKSDNP